MMGRIWGVHFGGDTLDRSARKESNRGSEVIPLNEVIYLSSLNQDKIIIDYIFKNFDKEGIWDHPLREI